MKTIIESVAINFYYEEALLKTHSLAAELAGVVNNADSWLEVKYVTKIKNSIIVKSIRYKVKMYAFCLLLQNFRNS